MEFEDIKGFMEDIVDFMWRQSGFLRTWELQRMDFEARKYREKGVVLVICGERVEKLGERSDFILNMYYSLCQSWV